MRLEIILFLIIDYFVNIWLICSRIMIVIVLACLVSGLRFITTFGGISARDKKRSIYLYMTDKLSLNIVIGNQTK